MSIHWMAPADREWVRRKWEKIRESQQLADKADAHWKAVNAAINKKLEAEGVTDIVQIDKIKGQSLALKNDLAMGGWHSRNAERHIHDVQLFLRLKELEIL